MRRKIGTIAMILITLAVSCLISVANAGPTGGIQVEGLIWIIIAACVAAYIAICLIVWAVWQKLKKS